ncbi:GNAT family N-acetyltransferase [Plantactinospora sp. BC1]|uniref:GNAT family N-acetyltransferase n=1 Tax=Plantactinospora sp. BC1 TaxID=2108470 RepID=UPI001F36A287|nr:GNAT family N-acetyltransferase [Plantactinospora sp. BC1]
MGTAGLRLTLRQCRPEDVAVLERHFPTGRNRYHEARYQRQRAGSSTFLIACLDAVPVGSGEVMWQGAKDPDVRDRFPGCPEINGLAVLAERRSQGVGSAIIRAAEHLAARRGRHRIGMGVEEQNVRAARLYLRLGYRDTGCRYLDRYPYVDDHGVRHEIADACRFLVKTISALPG